MIRRTVATDDFNRANGAIGANWTESSSNDGLSVVSNEVTSANAGSFDNAMFWNANSFGIDHYSKVTIADLGSGTPYMGVIARANASDYVQFQCREGDPPEINCYWYNGGAYTDVGEVASHTWAVGDTMIIDAIGSTFFCYVNDSLVLSARNTSAPATGSPGIAMYSTSAEFDNWEGGHCGKVFPIVKASSGDTLGVSSKSVAVTIPSGFSNLLMLVLVKTRDGTDADRNVTGITWNTSETLTQYKEQNDDTADLTSEIWGLINPTVGTYNVVVSYAGTVDITSVDVVVLAGAKQSDQPNATGGASAASAISTSVTTDVDECLVIDAVYSKDDIGVLANDTRGQLYNYLVNSNGDTVGVSYTYKDTAGSQTMAWACDESAVISAVAIEPELPTPLKFTQLDNGVDATTGSSAVTASKTPTANALQLLAVVGRTDLSTDTNTPTVSGCGLTWESIGTVLYDTSGGTRRRLTLFRALGSSPSAGQLTIDFNSQNQTDIVWSWTEVTGVDTSGSNGSGAIVQSDTDLDTGIGATVPITFTSDALSAFGSTENRTYACFASDTADLRFTEGSGFRLLCEQNAPVNGATVVAEYSDTADTVADGFVISVGSICSIVVEVKAGSPVQESTVQKALVYKVVTTTTVQKSLRYSVLAPSSPIQKSATYAVVTPTTIQKGVVYKVLSAQTITKQLAYTVITSTTVQKSLVYKVVAPAAITKQLKYTILEPSAPIQKSARYAVITTSLVQKQTIYTVLISTTIQKSLTYDVLSSSTVTVNKDLTYKVLRSSTLTKNLVYTIKGSVTLQKSLVYRVVVTTAITKSLSYSVLRTTTIEKQLIYVTLPRTQAHTVTKRLKYTVAGQKPKIIYVDGKIGFHVSGTHYTAV